MEKTIQGNIPANITIIHNGVTKKVRQNWDDFEDGTTQEFMVQPAFVSDSSNKKTLETGRLWAERQDWNTSREVQEVTKPNNPTEGYRIVTLEKRDEGGRAYKVVSPHTPYGFYFDLREDILLDLLINVGVQPGGILNGEYIFAKVGNQMKLVRVDSELHRRLIDATTRKNTKNISKPAAGHIYRNKKGEYLLFGGLVDTIEPKYRKVRKQYGYYGGYEKEDVFDHYEELKNQQLWIKLSSWKVNKSNNPKDIINEMFNDDYYWAYELKKSGVAVEDIEDTGLTTEEIVSKVVESMRRVTSGDRRGSDCYYTSLSCIVPVGTKKEQPELYKNIKVK